MKKKRGGGSKAESLLFCGAVFGCGFDMKGDIEMRGKREKKEIRAGQFHIRISDREAGMFQYVRDQTGKTFSDIVRDGLKMQYELERVKATNYDEIEEGKEVVKEPDYSDFVEDFYEEDEEDEGDFEERWGRF